MQIPFNRPYLTGNELKYIDDCIVSTQGTGTISGDGKYTHLVQAFFESTYGAKKVLTMTSGTTALELAIRLLELKPGDEVILPSFTFSSTANAVILGGGKPVFADITEDTQNIDPLDIRSKISPKTRAIIPVHYAGVACPMDEIMEIAREYNLVVIEDAAHGVNAKYKGKPLGAIGDFGAYSFHETKNYVCGEGGLLLFNSGKPEVIERAEVIREKGTNRSKFHRGEVDKYTWVDEGSSYLPSDILMAFLYAQLEQLREIQNLRLHIWNTYYHAFRPYEREGKIRLPIIPDYAEHNAHMFYILFHNIQTRDRVMDQLKESGIHAVFHYVPLHSAPLGQRFGNRHGDLPVTEDVSGRLLRLPMYAGINEKELEYIITTLSRLLNMES
jgi:dTDP-4-amino-4,6-dideoxygalactose transaminase